MPSAHELRPGMTFLLDGVLYECVQYHHIQRPRLAPLIRLKYRNYKLGTTNERTFSPDDRFPDAQIDEKDLQFLYKQGEGWHFMDTESYEQYEFNEKQVGEGSRFLKEDTMVKMVMFNGEVLGIKLPTKVELKIVEAPPAVKGDTSGNVTKGATVETGAIVQVPIFIKEGEIIRVDTRSGEYVERVNK
ncbi:MAG: elongation factor P [Spirochaetia bacterium]|nr:elongation factor P [Spirochaetia bacterium]